MDLSTIELEPLVDEHSSPTEAPPSEPVHHRFGWIVVAAAVGATFVFGASVLFADDPEPPPVVEEPVAVELPAVTPVAEVALARPSSSSILQAECMSETSGSADTRERWADDCRAAVEEQLVTERIYASCMRDAGGSPDSMERRAERCRQDADARGPAERLYASCMRSTGGSPDAMERRAGRCAAALP